MASVEKLLITGIRSFSPRDQSVIEFYTPLTIIVGHNGAGKTTIIECLKYATTGDQPPNSKGGAFVHDPKIANEREIKAQIKLKFRSVTGQQLVCTRSIQLSQRAKKLEMKTLESVLLTKDPITGEKISISGRCADIDKEMPLQLGVSPAILENVIFCHQEESYWPLSEPSILKKKFDEIFSATKYTKALEAIKDIRKEQNVEIKILKERSDNFKIHRETAERVQAQISRLQCQVDQVNIQFTSIDAEIVHLDQLIEGLEKNAAHIAVIQDETRQLIMDKQSRERANAELYESMTPYTETDEELRQLLEEHVKQLKNAQSAAHRMEGEQNHLRQKLDVISQQYAVKCREQGGAQQDFENYQKKINELTSTLSDLKSKYNLKDDQNSRDETISHLQQQRISFDDTMSLTKRMYDEHENSLTETIDRLRGEKDANVAIEQLKTQQQEDIQRQKNEKHTLLQKLQSSIQGVAVRDIEHQIEEVEMQLSTGPSSSHITDATLISLEQQRHALESKWNLVNTSLNTFHKHYEVMTRLSLIEKECQTKKKESKQMIEQTLAWTEDPGESLEDFQSSHLRIQTFYNNVKLDEEKGHSHLSSVVVELTSRLENKRHALMTKRTALDRLLEQLAECNAVLSEFPTSEDYLRQLAQVKDAVKVSEKQLILLESSHSLYESYILQTREHHQCPVCSRSFSDITEEQLLEQKMTSVHDSLPTEIDVAKKAREKMLEQLETLQRLFPHHELRAKLTNESSSDICSLQDEITSIEHDVTAMTAEVNQINEQLLEQEAKSRLTQQALESVVRLESMLKQWLIYEQEKQSIRALLPPMDNADLSSNVTSSSMCLSLEELQVQSASIHADIQRINSEMTESRRLQDEDREKRHTLQSRLFSLRQQLTENAKEQQQQLTCQEDLLRLSHEQEQVTQTLTTLSLKMGPLEQTLSEHMKEREELRRRREEHLSELRKQCHACDQEYMHLKAMIDDVVSFEKREIPTMIKSLGEQMSIMDERREEIQRQLERCAEHVQLLHRQATEVQVIERHITDNLRHRENERFIEKIKEKLVIMERELGGLNVLSGDLAQMQEKKQTVVSRRHRMEGEKTALQAQMARYMADLQTDALRDIEDKYRRVVLDLKTIDMAQDDLEKYYKALDNAIMKYHAIKMEEINKIIRELWINTYRGSDIDTVEIRSDCETTLGSRSYNYRVVMLKGDTELDMRGRCSAGQKVLTSLIIRLALAETFCLNCGILALDEPTTNLDQSNVESLAESLANIIKMRRQQSNFQLIVITHDEEFVRLLGRSEYADYYWRVYKDSNQHSVIERQDIDC